MKKLYTILMLVVLLSPGKAKSQAEDTISIMYYNLLNFPQKAQERADTLKKIVQHVLPDMFVVNELTSQFGASLIINNALNQNGINYYQQANFIDGPDTDNLLFYNSNKLGLKSQYVISTSLRDINEYVMYYKAADLATTQDTIYFYMYSCHLKASSGVDNENKRYNESISLKNRLSSLAGIHNIFVGGDFNLYGDHEPAFGHILNGGSVKLYDPIDMAGYWNNNSLYASIHTQSTRGSETINGGSTGGMDDRFDFIFISNDVQTGANGTRYVPGSYEAVGQDGQHFNASISDAPATPKVPADVALALRNMSDHLPVYMEVAVGGDVGITENDFVSTYYFDSESHELTIYLNDLEKELSFNVYDLSGKLVGTERAFNTNYHEATFRNLKSGIYIIELSNGLSKTAMKVVAY